ncbi:MULTISPECIES: ECF transporter S component [Paenibacillus]|uniref:Thiamine ABC transporter permease n=1 Tax=Paenibacillus campinasensis TaxID=66347 RepID=A0A268EXY2_9BACL|nr:MULTISPECIES: ECF transporter S component [Paenibacillus]MUG66520.1 thiamine ABC transporter permease [Paenibacillus campinasensis]PAD77990.1 thiamine ABC transporter permease [Paenibacillus campinasensis]PAK52930.1 thiamine ABC transporter permease [Paenibacillus sp. 7541]
MGVPVKENLELQSRKGLRVSDILVTVLVSLVFGIVYHFWGSVYSLLKPFQADELLYGMWFAAATLAFLLIRKPGVAIIAELAAAHVEVLFGSGWGLTLLMYGLIQGLGAELVFAAFRYRNYSVWVAAAAGAVAALGSMVLDFYYSYTDDLESWLFIAKYGMRILSGAVIAGLLMVLLAKALERTGVTALLRPASSKDYEALDDPRHG